ncbi:unnamed protein product [Brassica oleracea]
MKSATLFVVSCVLIFFVLPNTKVEADDCAPQLDYLHSGKCDPNAEKAARQCVSEIQDKCYPRCSCRNNESGHQYIKETEHHALSLVSKHRTNTVDHASVVLSLSIACHSPQQTYAHNENVRWPSGSTECFSHTTTRGRQFDTREKRGGTGLAKKSLREFLARWPFGVSPVTIKSSTYTETYAHKSKYNDPK